MIFSKSGRPLSPARRPSPLLVAPTALALVLLVSIIESGNNFAQQSQQLTDTATAKTLDSSAQGQNAPAGKDNLRDDNLDRLPPVDKYRMEIGFRSLYFTAVPLGGAVLLIILALWVGKQDIKDRLLPFFGDGQFGQYVVVILVAGNVCTLAIVGILGRSEVAAIYGGIIGYVLGKKAGNNGGQPLAAHPPGQPDAH